MFGLELRVIRYGVHKDFLLIISFLIVLFTSNLYGLKMHLSVANLVLSRFASQLTSLGLLIAIFWIKSSLGRDNILRLLFLSLLAGWLFGLRIHISFLFFVWWWQLLLLRLAGCLVTSADTMNGVDFTGFYKVKMIRFRVLVYPIVLPAVVCNFHLLIIPLGAEFVPRLILPMQSRMLSTLDVFFVSFKYYLIMLQGLFHFLFLNARKNHLFILISWRGLQELLDLRPVINSLLVSVYDDLLAWCSRTFLRSLIIRRIGWGVLVWIFYLIWT